MKILFGIMAALIVFVLGFVYLFDHPGSRAPTAAAPQKQVEAPPTQKPSETPIPKVLPVSPELVIKTPSQVETPPLPAPQVTPKQETTPSPPAPKAEDAKTASVPVKESVSGVMVGDTPPKPQVEKETRAPVTPRVINQTPPVSAVLPPGVGSEDCCKGEEFSFQAWFRGSERVPDPRHQTGDRQQRESFDFQRWYYGEEIK